MIPISSASEYAIRALTYLASRRGEGGFWLVRRIAEEIGVPGPFLVKILQPLVQCGILESQRGRGGGYRLARSAGDVTLLEIVDAQERLQRTRKCLLGQAECSDERACPLHEYWKWTHEGFISRLRRTTLKDLTRFCQARPQSGYPGGRRSA